MDIKTTGIILHSIKHTDSTSIVTIYTRHFGRISYMIHGVNKKKSVFRSAFLQPLLLVEMDVYHSSKKNLQRIKDVRSYYTFISIPYDPVKNALALFISEVLFRTLSVSEPDETIFAFLENSIQQLDHCTQGVSNFHLVFLIKLSRFLGFAPNSDELHDGYFDLMNGVFIPQRPPHSHYLLKETTTDFSTLISLDYSTLNLLVLSRQRRVKLVESLIEYYRLHVPEFNGLHSLSVLQSLFD